MIASGRRFRATARIERHRSFTGKTVGYSKVGAYFETDEEGKRHGDEHEEPAENGEDPPANADAGVAVVSCGKRTQDINGLAGERGI